MRFWPFRKRIDYSKFAVEELKIDGNKIFVFTDPMKMPYKRILQYFVAVDSVRYGLVREDLVAFKEAMRAEISQGNWSKVAGIFEHFVAFTDLYAVEKNMIHLGATFIMIKGEDPNEIDEQLFLKKYSMCEQSEEVKAFFLSRSYDLLKELSKSKDGFDILAYLKNPVVRKAAQTFLSLIHGRSNKEGLPS